MLLRHRRRTPPALPSGRAELAYTIRRASEDDARHLSDLATLDHGRAPGDAALVAELDGEVVAALDLRTHRTVADPFRPTADAVELLRLRAAQLANADEFTRAQAAPAPQVAARWTPGAPHH